MLFKCGAYLQEPGLGQLITPQAMGMRLMSIHAVGEEGKTTRHSIHVQTINWREDFYCLHSHDIRISLTPSHPFHGLPSQTQMKG